MTAPELAARTGATAAQLAELIAAGVVRPTADDAFAVADMNRVRIAQALGSEGYALADVARLIARGALPFDAITHLMAEPMSLDERTLDERMGEAGVTREQLERLYEIWDWPDRCPARPRAWAMSGSSR